MTPEQRAEVKDRILTAVEKVRASGAVIRPSHYGVRHNGTWKRTGTCVCPLGALLCSEQPGIEGDGDIKVDAAASAALAIGANRGDVVAFVNGFDGIVNCPHPVGPWYDFGRELRAELLEEPTRE